MRLLQRFLSSILPFLLLSAFLACRTTATNSTSASNQTIEKACESITSEIALGGMLEEDFYARSDSKVLASCLVQSLDDRLGRDPAIQPQEVNQLVVATLVKPKILSKTLENGLLNIHQTGTSNALTDEARRRDLENTFMQRDLGTSDLANQLRPKSALFIHPAWSGFSLPTNQYGNAVIVLKPQVYPRTTWTYTDSLELEGNLDPGLFPRKLTDPWYPDTFPPVGSTIISPSSLVSNLKYAETQIWGRIDPADIEFIALPEGHRVTKKLQRSNIPVKFYPKEPKQKDILILAGREVNTIDQETPTFESKTN